MKKSICLLLLVIWTQPSLCINQCLKLNPFLPIIQTEGVVLNVYPQISHQIHKCTQEWSVFGTCCTYDSIVRYALKDKQRMIDYRLKLDLHIASIMNSFQKIQRFASALSKRNYVLQQEYKDFLYFMESSLTKGHRDMLLRQDPSLETPQGFEECLSTFENARSTSLCSVCSGRSSVWFQGQKAKMSPGQCGYIIEKCSKVFKSTFGYIESLGEFMEKIHLLRIDRVMSASDINSAQRLQSAIGEVKNLDIFDIIMRYNRARTFQERVSSGAAICSSLITLAHVPFLRGLESLVGSVANYVRHWFVHASRIAAENIKLTSPTNWSSRRLLQNGPSNFEPRGDVLVIFNPFSSMTISPLNRDTAPQNSIHMTLNVRFP